MPYYARLKDMSEEEKLERKKQQRRDAQKRYYEKNKAKYQKYGNDYYWDIKDKGTLFKNTLMDIKTYITSIPNYKHLSYFMDILEKIDGVIDDNR